jgi:hypothetical protein
MEMSMKTEKDLQKAIMVSCKLRMLFVQKMESRTARGFPDLMVCHDGRVLLIEVKTPAGTGRLSKLQLKRHRQLRAAGMDVVVVDDPAVAERYLDEFCD